LRRGQNYVGVPEREGVLLGGPSQDAETSFASLSALKKKFN